MNLTQIETGYSKGKVMTMQLFSIVRGATRAGRAAALRLLQIALLGLGLAILPPLGASVAVPQGIISPIMEPEGGAVAVAPLIKHLMIREPALAQGEAVADRKIMAGILLILFAGFSTLTLRMWREVGRAGGPR